MGRPVILPRTNLGLKAVHGKDGYILDKADAAGIVKAVEEICKDERLKEKLIEGGRNFYFNRLAKTSEELKLCAFFSGN